MVATGAEALSLHQEPAAGKPFSDPLQAVNESHN